jgi:hypothetical protein
MSETREWSTAPKDGSEINVQFPDGTKARARWNEIDSEWQVRQRDGEWKRMAYLHGGSDPRVWWP